MNTTASPQPTSVLSTDLLGSPMQQLTHAALSRIKYTPFGHANEPFTGSIGFAGQRKEPATALYLLGNGYRGYSTGLMRFAAPDELSPFGRGGLNTYAYCVADPVNSADPDGHALVRSLGKLMQRIFAGRKPNNITRITEKLAASQEILDLSKKGVDTFSKIRTATHEAHNVVVPRGFARSDRLSIRERTKFIQGRLGDENTFKGTIEIQSATARVANKLGIQLHGSDLKNPNMQEHIFRKGRNVFQRKVERYQAKLPAIAQVKPSTL